MRAHSLCLFVASILARLAAANYATNLFGSDSLASDAVLVNEWSVAAADAGGTVSFEFASSGQPSGSLSIAIAAGAGCQTSEIPASPLWQRSVAGEASFSVANVSCTPGASCCVVVRNNAALAANFQVTQLVSGDAGYRQALASCSILGYRLWAGLPVFRSGRGLVRCARPAQHFVGALTATADGSRVMLGAGDACDKFEQGASYEFFGASRAVLDNGEVHRLEGFGLDGTQPTSCIMLDCPASDAACGVQVNAKLGMEEAPTAVELNTSSPSREIAVAPYAALDFRQWAVTSTAGSVIALECMSLDTATGSATLTAFDGPSDTGRQLLVASGSGCPADQRTAVYSTGSAAFLRFSNTGAGSGAGLRYRVSAASPSTSPSATPTPHPTGRASTTSLPAPTPQSGQRTVTLDLSRTPPGSVQIIQYGPFDDATNRAWRVSTSSTGYSLRIRCEDIDVGIFHTVNVFDGWPRFPGIPVASWSGSFCSPQSVRVRSSRALITFEASSVSSEQRGFTLQVSKEERLTPSPSNSPRAPSPTPSPQPDMDFDAGEIQVGRDFVPVVMQGYGPSDSQTLLLEADAGRRLAVSCESINTADGLDSLFVYNGVSRKQLLATWSGFDCIPATVTTSGSNALLVFSARSTRPAGGFRVVARSQSVPSPSSSPKPSNNDDDDAFLIVFAVVMGIMFALFGGFIFCQHGRNGGSCRSSGRRRWLIC